MLLTFSEPVGKPASVIGPTHTCGVQTWAHGQTRCFSSPGVQLRIFCCASATPARPMHLKHPCLQALHNEICLVVSSLYMHVDQHTQEFGSSIVHVHVVLGFLHKIHPQKGSRSRKSTCRRCNMTKQQQQHDNAATSRACTRQYVVLVQAAITISACKSQSAPEVDRKQVLSTPSSSQSFFIC